MYTAPYLIPSSLTACVSAAKVNATLKVDVKGQPFEGEVKREPIEGSASVPSLSAAATQEPSSSAECKCGCHDPPVPCATAQVKQEPHVKKEPMEVRNGQSQPFGWKLVCASLPCSALSNNNKVVVHCIVMCKGSSHFHEGY